MTDDYTFYDRTDVTSDDIATARGHLLCTTEHLESLQRALHNPSSINPTSEWSALGVLTNLVDDYATAAATDGGLPEDFEDVSRLALGRVTSAALRARKLAQALESLAYHTHMMAAEAQGVLNDE